MFFCFFLHFISFRAFSLWFKILFCGNREWSLFAQVAVAFLGVLSFFLISFCFFFLVVFVNSVLVDVCVFTFFRYELRFCFLVDVYSSFFFFVVCVIRFVVYVFSFMYMRGTVNSRRFFFVLSIFVFSMAVLVFSGNFFCFLIG